MKNIDYSIESPLISVLVITYNSSKYVIETLESIKRQSYQNIELIISDDCSTDNTVEICEDWLCGNNNRFISSTLVNAKSNSGIPANLNRGLKKPKGSWIKIIAGDDALYTDAIENIVKTITSNSEIEIILSKVDVFRGEFTSENFFSILPDNWVITDFLSPDVSSKKQIEFLLNGFHFPAPGFYLKKELITQAGGYDERFKLIEDIPFFLKVLLLGKKIYFTPFSTVKYRKHSESLTGNSCSTLASYHLQYAFVLFKGSLEYGKTKFIIINAWNLIFVKMIFLLGNEGKLSIFLNKFRIYLNPRRVFSLFRI